MKDTFRKSMRWFHTWSSLVLGWILFFIFVTGTTGYFSKEIDRWMQPELPMVTHASTSLDNEELSLIAVNYLKEVAPYSNKWRIYLPHTRDERLIVKWYSDHKATSTSFGGHGGPKPHTHIINPLTKKRVIPRETGGGNALYKMHYVLHYVDARTTGRYIVGFASMLMLIALLTGIIIHINIFKDFFTFRQDKNLRSWLDAHMVSGVIALPFHLMITYSGLAFFIFSYVPFVPLVNYDMKMPTYIQKTLPSEKPIKINYTSAELASIKPIVKQAETHFKGKIKSITILNQGDTSATICLRREDSSLLGGNKRDKVFFSGTTGKMLENLSPKKPEASEVRNILTGIHRGLFADIYIRWLYFLSGILGSVMIATGLILWTKKRESKQKDTFGFKFVNSLNVASIAGLPVAIAAYFWANRLLPFDFPHRADMEMDILFITWFFIFIFAMTLPKKVVWYVQFYLASFLYGSLPILNFFLTQRHLIQSLSLGDTTLAWIDTLFFLIGVIFFIIAHVVKKKTP